MNFKLLPLLFVLLPPVGRHVCDPSLDKCKAVISICEDSTLTTPHVQTQMYSFIDETTGLVGYKNGKGEVVAAAQFSDFLYPEQFDNIAIVSKYTDEKPGFCYLTSKGRIIETVNPYFYDNGPDVEYNGFIRFSDKLTDNAGLMNRYGDVVIPPQYSVMSQVHNGFVEALSGAKRVPFDSEHYYWEGGENILLDTLGNLLIEKYNSGDRYQLDYYSVEITSTPNPDTTRFNYRGVNGKYYSFANNLTEFDKWLKANLLSDFTPDRFRAVISPFVEMNINYGETIIACSDSIMSQYYDKFYQALIRMNDPSCDFFHSLESINESDVSPTIRIVITSINGVQECFNFVRTLHGYRLLSATLREKTYVDY